MKELLKFEINANYYLIYISSREVMELDLLNVDPVAEEKNHKLKRLV